METSQIVRIRGFSSLDDFIEHNNNFYGRMVVDSAMSHVTERVHIWPCYTRFTEIAPELALELRQEMTMQNYVRHVRYGEPWRNVFPWEKLWEAYKIMSNLVYLGDPFVKGLDDFNFLIQ